MTHRRRATCRPPFPRRPLAVCCVAATALSMPAACSGDESAGSAVGADHGGASVAPDTADRSPGADRGGGAVDPSDDQDIRESMERPAHTTGDSEPTIVTSGGQLPARFPTGIPLPDGYVVNMASESTAEDALSFVVQLEAPGDPRALFDLLTARFVETGWQELQRSTSNLGDSPSASATYANGSILVNLGSIQGGTPGTVAVTYSVVPAES